MDSLIFYNLTNWLHKLISKKNNNANHQVKGYLGMPPDHDVAGAKMFLQTAVGAFCAGTNLIPLRFMRRHRYRHIPPSIFIDDRDMTKTPVAKKQENCTNRLCWKVKSTTAGASGWLEKLQSPGTNHSGDTPSPFYFLNSGWSKFSNHRWSIFGCHSHPPKTKGSVRDIDMFPPVKDALLRQQRIAGKDKYVFRDAAGNLMIPDHAREVVWKPTLLKANLSYRPMQQTRHTFATFAIDTGEDLGWVQAMLGHSS